MTAEDDNLLQPVILVNSLPGQGLRRQEGRRQGQQDSTGSDGCMNRYVQWVMDSFLIRSLS